MSNDEIHSNSLVSLNEKILFDRPIISQKSFDQVFIPTTYEDRTPVILGREIRSYIRRKCFPSKQCSQSYLNVIFPFLSWLKIYQMAWLPHDVICGVTIAIMQIPQAMAYALLARLPPIVGLYISFFPSLVYCWFGTSRHLSVGAIAVVSLMTGHVVDHFTTQAALTAAIANASSSDSVSDITIDPWYSVTVATTLAFGVGMIQLLLCIFHLGFVTSFLSDTFISGYTTGTAILVLTSQIPDIFGLTLKRYYGPFNIIYTCIEIVSNLKRTNLATLAVSLSSIAILIIVKEYLEPLYKKYVKKIKLFQHVQIPIPIELVVIIIGTLVSHRFDLNPKYKVKIVSTIGRGFRPPTSPSWILLPSLIKDAIIIAIVSFAISTSLAKTFAKKFNYTLDSNQELAAYGFCNIIGSIFSSFPSAGSLSRTSVFVNVGGRTQLASIISCLFLLIIILRIGPLFEALPKACLAAIIVVALKGLLWQMKDLSKIGRVTKLEAIVWLVTFFGTILLDVDYGLIAGIIASLIVVILRQFRPRTTILGQYERSEVYQNVKRFTHVHEIPHIKVFRFESPVVYFNADYFRQSLLDAVNIDLKNAQKRSESVSSDSNLSYVIVDCSSISQLDYSGGKIFLQALKELNDCQYKVYLCNLIYYNYELLEKLKINDVCPVMIMATIHDAVHHIQDQTNEQSYQNDKSENNGFLLETMNKPMLASTTVTVF